MKIKECKRTSSPKLPDGVQALESTVGDECSFELLYQRYSSSLFNFIYRFFGDYDQASDILQQVFLKLYMSLPMLDMGKSLKSWLFQVARNRCLDELRRKHTVNFSELESVDDEEETPFLMVVPDPHPLPEEVAEQHELQESLQKAIQLLPQKFRSVVLLRYGAQLSFSEIGKTLHMPEATAKTYFYRARPLLQALLAS
jgi:RNA polymerase sigma-70 factor, ECF subfamily